MNKNTILIVEDDNDINNLLKEILLKEGYIVEQAFSGTEGKLLIENNHYDLILLDLMLPGMTGEELTTYIREEKTMPIIIISAKLDMDTKVNLLKIGADDFIEKPFDIKEVLARIEAQLRRYKMFSREDDREVLEFKNLKLYKEERKVYVNGKEIKFTLKEFDILEILLSYPNKVFTKSNLYESLWGENSYMDDNTINVHISNIRNKISEYDDLEYIETVWGIGFKLNS